MRLQVTKSKNAASFYVIKSVYDKGKRTSKVVEKLGTYDEFKTKLGDKDPYEWAKDYVAELTRLEKEGKEPVVIAKYSPNKLIDKDIQRSFNGGYLFLQQIYHELGFDKISISLPLILTLFYPEWFMEELYFLPQNLQPINYL